MFRLCCSELTLTAKYNSPTRSKVTLLFAASFRKILDGERTISESDDVIQPLSGVADTAKAESITLFKKEDLRPAFWQLVASGDATFTAAEIRNSVNAGFGKLLFTSFADARNFLFWLQRKWKTIPATGTLGTQGHRFQLPGGQPFSQEVISRLRIIPVTDITPE